MMHRKKIFLVFALLGLTMTYAQKANREISEETTEKKYEMYEEGTLINKSVKIHTVIRQEIKFAEEDKGKIDARRIVTPKDITKTVSIDSDADEGYDEVIKFSYTSEAKKDFLFGTNDNEIFRAIENSKYLNLHRDSEMSEDDLNSLFVITDNDGKILQLILENHTAM